MTGGAFYGTSVRGRVTPAGEFAQILTAITELRKNTSEILQRLTAQETQITPLLHRIELLESTVAGLALAAARINGLPGKNSERIHALEMFRWKATAAVGTAGIVGGGIGSVAVQLILRSLN